MELYSYFGDLINVVTEQQAKQFSDLDFVAFQDSISNVITELDSNTVNIEPKAIASAKFAVYAWIDETVQRSSW
jgi:type VI protein secretion system component VasF